MTALERKELLVHIHTCEASQVALVVKNPPTNARDIRHGLDPWVRKILWRRKWQPTPVESHGQNPWRIPWREEPGGLHRVRPFPHQMV